MDASATAEAGLGGRPRPQRRKKTAGERRAQRLRSDARFLQRILRALDEVSHHRGSCASRLGTALQTALKITPDSFPKPPRKEQDPVPSGVTHQVPLDAARLDPEPTAGEQDRDLDPTPPESKIRRVTYVSESLPPSLPTVSPSCAAEGHRPAVEATSAATATSLAAPPTAPLVAGTPATLGWNAQLHQDRSPAQTGCSAFRDSQQFKALKAIVTKKSEEVKRLRHFIIASGLALPNTEGGVELTADDD